MNPSTVYALINANSNKKLKIVGVEDKNALNGKLEPYRRITAQEYLEERCETNKLFLCFA